MGDVKDILGVPRDGLAPAPKSKKKDEPKLVKPKGMSRCASGLHWHCLWSRGRAGGGRGDGVALGCDGPALPLPPSSAPPAVPLTLAAFPVRSAFPQGGVCAAQRLAPAHALPADERHKEEGGHCGAQGKGAARPARHCDLPGAALLRTFPLPRQLCSPC